MKRRQRVRPQVRRQRPITRATYQRILRLSDMSQVDFGDLQELLGAFERAADDDTRQRLKIDPKWSRLKARP